MSIYKKNLGIISSITNDQYIGYCNNSLIIDDRYLSYIRPCYNFTKIYNIIKTSFLKVLLYIEISKTNEYNNLITNGLDCLLLLSNNTFYNNLDQVSLKNLHANLYKLFSEIKKKNSEFKALEIFNKLKEHTKININENINENILENNTTKNSNDINPKKKHSRLYKSIVCFFSYIKDKFCNLKTTIFSLF